MPFYVDRFETDEAVKAMGYEAEGVYGALMRHQWREGSIPWDDDALRAILKPHSDESLAAAKRCFVQDSSRASRGYNETLRLIRNSRSQQHRGCVDRGRKGGVKKALNYRSKLLAELENNPSPALARASISSSKAVEDSIHTEVQEQHKTSWLTPYFDAWVRAYQGDPSPKELARFIAPLRKKYGDPAVLAAWENYLGQTDATYASPARFSKTYGKWSGAAPSLKLSTQSQNEETLRKWAAERRPNGE
jgi:hypothetical protein